MSRFDQDRMFLAVVDGGSFAAGARKMGTSSGQASKLVARLEADLGVHLINRTTRAIALTESGRLYHSRLKDILAEFDALDATIRHSSSLPKGKLVISAPETFGTLHLMPILLDFAKAYADIELDIRFSDRAAHLIDEGLDLALRIGAPPDSSLIARRLCDAQVIMVATPEYLNQHGTPQHPFDLNAHECIFDTNIRDPKVWRFQGHEAVALHGRLAFSNAEACLKAVLSGMGVARVPSFIAGPIVRDGLLTRVLAAYDPPARPIQVLYPASRHLAPKSRALIDHLVEAFRGQPVWDQGW